MKFLIAALCLGGTIAHANPYSDREAQLEAQRKAVAYAQAGQAEAAVVQQLHAKMQRMAAAHGGLTSAGEIKVSMVGNTMLPMSTPYFTTGDNLACEAMYHGTLCRDANCSGAAFGAVNCIDGNGQRLKLGPDGRRYAWPTDRDILRMIKRRR